MRVATWNIQHGGGKRISTILRALETISADTLILSEFRNNLNGDLLRNQLASLGYTAQSLGVASPRENSLIIASREGLDNASANSVASELDSRRCVRTFQSSLNIWGVYFACGPAKESLFQQILAASQRCKDQNAILIGDFNTGKHYQDEEGKTFVCEKYMHLLAKIGWMDAWRHLHGDAREYSWYSHAGRGFRIDHAFVTPALATSIISCEYRHEFRKQECSDHAPLVLELDIRR